MFDADLLDQFVASFHKFDDMSADGPIPSELDAGFDDSKWARQKWSPAKIATDADAIVPVYNIVPGRFPPLFEQLVLSYRWLEVELGDFVRLFPNPPGPTLQCLTDNITADRVLCSVLFPLGLIPFGKVCGGNYDPLCFATRNRQIDGDCPVVRIDHESVLCNGQLGKTWQVASAFRRLVRSIINKANELPEN